MLVYSYNYGMADIVTNSAINNNDGPLDFENDTLLPSWTSWTDVPIIGNNVYL